MLAAKGFKISGRINIGHGRDRLIRVKHFRQLAPGTFHLGKTCHIRHRATGREIGQDGNLLRLGKNIRDFSHEMDATKYQIIRICFHGKARQLQGIAGEIGMLINIRTLIMMGEYYDALSECGFSLHNALRAVVIFQVIETFKCNSFRWHGCSCFFSSRNG